MMRTVGSVWATVLFLISGAHATTIVYPSPGRPVFVEPGGSFVATVQFGEAPDEVQARLVSDRPFSYEQPVDLRPELVKAGVVRVTVVVPDDVAERTYDLELRSKGSRLATARHSVAVRRLGRRIRIVHLSDMNIGDVGAPEFDTRLIDEINLLAPTLIVATGDLLDATHPDLRRGWGMLSRSLSRFDAPVLAACGDHDALPYYAEYLAPSPVGAIDVGRYRGLVLYDTPAAPISADTAQVDWVVSKLADQKPELTFVVAHDACPNLLSHWQRQGALERMIRDARLGIWFAGGSSDWDGREYRTLIAAAEPLLYVRTHESSSATCGGASGVSHYRVLDLEGDRAILYGPDTDSGLPGSIAVGRLRMRFDGENNGTQQRVALKVVNTLPFRMNHLGGTVLVDRAGDARPWCHGARITRLVNLGTMWECHVAFDVPDKGSLRALVGTGPEPDLPTLGVRFELPNRVSARPTRHGDVRFASDGTDLRVDPTSCRGLVYIENRGDAVVETTPIVRLDGQSVAYRVANSDGPFASAYELRLAPREAFALQLDLPAVRVTPGRRELQVYLKMGPVQVPACWPLDVRVGR